MKNYLVIAAAALLSLVSCSHGADCDSCGLCKVYGGRDMEEVYADYI